MTGLALSPIVPRPLKQRIGRGLGKVTSLRVQAQLGRLVRGNGPIIAGPWLGEVGFELLYWVPFLAWFAERYAVPRDRFVVLSRGGTAGWYQDIASRYHDVFDQIGPAKFRARNHERSAELGEQKQAAMTRFDRDLLKPLLEEHHASEDRVLHPSTMFQLFRSYWWGHADATWVQRHARFRLLTSPAKAELLARLPAEYVAVKFYYNESFPATLANRALAHDVLHRLRGAGPVVSLSTGLALDDHEGWEEEESLAAHGIRTDLSPSTNLALQTAIVANARAWVGTYGGFAYLAPFHRVAATAYYSVEGGFSARHLALALDVFARLSSRPLLSLHLAGELDSTHA